MEWEPGVRGKGMRRLREEGLTPVVNEIETERAGAAVVLHGNRYDSFVRENKLADEFDEDLFLSRVVKEGTPMSGIISERRRVSVTIFATNRAKRFSATIKLPRRV